jgi:hypothetical protein
VPPEWAQRFHGARAHAPRDAAAGDLDEHGLRAVTSGPVTDEIALHQAADAVAPGGPQARGRKPRDAPAALDLVDTLEDCRVQTMHLLGRLAPWGLREAIGPALLFILRMKPTLATAAEADRARWAPVVQSQKANLQRICGGVGQVLEAADSMGLRHPEAPEAEPLREILALYADAAAAAHLVDTGAALIGKAAARQASLPLRAVQAAARGAASAIDEMADATDVSDPQRRQLLREHAAVDGEAHALQSGLIAGAAVDPAALDQVTLESDELALRARILGLTSQLTLLERAAHDAGEGLAARIAGWGNRKFPDLDAVTADLRLTLEQIVEQKRASDLVAPIDPKLPAAERATAFRAIRRRSLAVAQRRLARIGQERGDIVAVLQEGAELVEWQSFRTACV